ncbi:MAG: hypothetical protein DMF79_07675 [Acidobacteria bacterium]|nr:MAG: hypothetical protein DMF79_07675 [Acidobacteriota bacterium]
MTPRPRIAREDLEPVLAAHHGNEALRAAFEGAGEAGRFLSVLARYVQFNSAFGPGLANLAGEIAARQGLFRDPDEPVKILADRAAEVGSDFFYAAIDEFDDRATHWRDTHRTLAQATVKGAGRFFGLSPEQLNAMIRINPTTEHSMALVQLGYGLGEKLTEERLFGAMGFHVGSEILADREFLIIDQVLHENRPDFVAALKAMKVEILGEKHDAYYWIHIHTGVEAEHFDAALRGVNSALRFYAGDGDPAEVKRFILAGFARFAEVQAGFMDALAEA